ncbi:LysR family transcriptional regulator [Microlunatus soli]|uniref:DNA-binding transcriptional regulator, LysR family n=1 Tax=Microlunatus soli TaxID=630515 RepID=A0A1H1NT10_9ACTN|nr:LysR family transcriptional regulator [Microlunatus soli]SDS02094.1 DNA-binding transcriptional regulator, LysR family [Microlunatus soli]
MMEPDDVPPAWLSSFLAVVDNATFTAAAATTHRSQPRVSAHVAGLERLLGRRLFERGSRPVQLTEAGERLLPHARAAMSEIRLGMEAVGSLGGDLQGTIVLGSFAGPSGVLLAPLIRRFRQSHPGVTIDLREGGPRWLEDAVASFALDLSIRVADMPTHHDLAFRHLLDEHIVLALPIGHQVTQQPDPERHLDGLPLIVTGSPTEGWTDFTDRLSAAGILPGSVLAVTHPTTVIAMVRAGLGIGMLGEMGATISAFGDVDIRRLPGELWTRGIRAYWHPKRDLSVASRQFLDDLADTCGSADQYSTVANSPA